MTRFYGQVGYVDANVENAPGVIVTTMLEISYYGTVVRNTRKLENGESVNDDISVNNSISIVADAYAIEHFHAIRYVRWAGSTWRVVTVDVERPRLILRLGGIYNGPTS